ncbi:MAG: c-type cytochrome biogenesis protein CcmI [Betaproteobacteria bacterium]
MLIFLIVALLMLIVALAFVVVPLLRERVTADPVSDAGSNVAIYKSQRRELDEELARGAISEAEHGTALAELSARVVDEVPESTGLTTNSTAASTRPWWLVAIIAIGMPMATLILYGTLGAPRAIEMTGMPAASAATSAGQPDAKAGEEPPMSDKQILAMVESLKQKMQQNPNDPRGWILLGRSQNALGRFVEAAAAYERAVALTPNDAQLLADFADAAVMTQQGRFEGKPYSLIMRALKLEPTNMKALALAGTAELRMGNRAASLAHWEKLKTLVEKDSADYREVESIIAEVKTTKLDAPTAMAAAPMATAPAPVATASADGKSNATAGVKITGKVAIAPDFISKLAAGDTLFVFARAKEGPRMPLAVMRVAAPGASGFPLSFELNDAMAMAPGMNLSKFSEVVIEARISKSGNAQLQPGDLSGVSPVIKPGATGVLVTIGKVVP